MDGQRTPQRTRQLPPSQPARQGLGADRRGRGARPSSPENGRSNGNGRGADRRGFGDRVREFTDHMPLVGRVTGRQQRRRINREWEEWGKVAPEDGPGGFYNEAPGPGYQDMQDMDNGMPDGYARPGTKGAARDRARGKTGRVRMRDRTFSIKLVSVLALLSIVVGFCCAQSTLTVVDAASAAVDAKAQVNAIEALAKGGNVTDTDTLKEIQTRLVTLNGDLVRLQSAIPGPIADTSTGASLNHTLSMSLKLVQAGRYGVDAALILVPHLKGVLKDVGSSSVKPTPTTGGTPGATPAPTATATAGPAPTPTPLPSTPPPGGLTMDDVSRAQQDVAIAGVLAQQALAERQYVNEGQLSRIGLGSVVSILHKMDSFAPKLPTYLGYANNIMAALPDLLGITKPAHYLLFNIDSDEMRSTGGFMGNYAVLTVYGGKLIGGVHLNDTATFDCNGPQSKCPTNYIPEQYAWMNADPSQFGMRDSNLSPDFPTSAKIIMQMYQDEMHKYHPTADASVDGVIMITPEIVRDMLKLTGDLQVPGFKQVVTASNLQDVIHFYHIQNRNSVAGGTKDQKAIDGLLGSALLHKVATLSAKEQSLLMKEILEGLSTKDVQVYLNDSRVESVLNALHMDSSIPMPSGSDAFMLTDVNVGATYFSRDMQEKVTDTITFDAQGNAIHDMTVSYHLPKINHLYTPIYIGKIGTYIFPITYYTGIMRVLVPKDSQAINGTLVGGELSAVQVQECTITTFSPGCPLITADEAGYVVWAAHINSLQVGTDTVIFRMQWKTPNALQTVNGVTQYKLTIYKQAGSHVAYDVKIMPPSKSQIAEPLALPLRTPDKTAAGTAAEFTSPSMVKNTVLTVTFAAS